MDIQGIIRTSIDVDAFEVIQRLGQDIGVIDRTGRIIGRVVNHQIVEYSLDIFDQVEKRVLYDQPFDVRFASTLISLYQQAYQFLQLQAEEIYQSSDYKTAHRLNVKGKRQ